MVNVPVNEALANFWSSPGSPDLPKGSLIGFPKTFVDIGEAEIHFDAVSTLRGRLVKAIGEDNVHCKEN